MGAILVVDDDESYLHTMKRLLERKYWPRLAITEVDPQSALRRLVAEPYAFDLVITDVDFPDIYDGVRLAREIAAWKRERAYSTRPKIICITGKDACSNIENLLAVRGIGGQFIDKEDEVATVVERGLPRNLYLAIDQALHSLKEEDAGPLLRIFYHPGKPGDIRPSNRAVIARMYNEGNGASFQLDIPPTPLLYLKHMCISKIGNSRGFTNEELEYLVSTDPSYKRRQRSAVSSATGALAKKPLSKNAALNNLRRLRNSLEQALDEVKWPEPIEKVFIITYCPLNPHDGASSIEELRPLSEKILNDCVIQSIRGYYARYRIRARVESCVLAGF